MASDPPQVGILMGSKSDWDTMKDAARTLETLGVRYRSPRGLRPPDSRQGAVLLRGR